MQPIRAQLVRCKTFTASTIVPAPVPNGSSLEEQINAFLAQQTERTLVQLDYEKTAGTFTALILYTE